MVTNRKSWLVVCFVLSLVIVTGVVVYLKGTKTINDVNGNFVIGIVFLIISFFSFRMNIFIYSIVCFTSGIFLVIPFIVRFVS